MLRDRLRKWDRSKNIKSKEMKAILRQLPAREHNHKRSEFRVRGIAVSITKLKRYRKIDESDIRHEVNRIKSPTPPALEVRTPPASRLAMPRSLRIPEELMKCIRDYIFGAIEEKIWISVGDAEPLQSKGENLGTATEYMSNLSTARDFFSNNQFSEAEVSLSRAEKLLDRVILSQPHDLIYDLIGLVAFSLRTQGVFRFVLPMIERSSTMAIALLGYGHRLARSVNLVYLLMREVENTSLVAAVESVYTSIVDSVEYALGPLHCTSLQFRLGYICRVIIHRDPEHSLCMIQQLICSCDAKCCGFEDIRPLDVRLYLANFLHCKECCRFEEAIVIATEIIERTQQPGFPWWWIPYYASEAYWILSSSQLKLGQDNASEKDGREAIRIRSTAFGCQDPRAQLFKTYLEDRLRYWGRTEAADDLRCFKVWQIRTRFRSLIEHDNDDDD